MCYAHQYLNILNGKRIYITRCSIFLYLHFKIEIHSENNVIDQSYYNHIKYTHYKILYRWS